MLRVDTHIHLDVYGPNGIPRGLAHADDYRAWIPGCEHDDILNCIETYGPDSRFAIGAALHPWEVPNEPQRAHDELDRIEVLACSTRVDFVGECGLDRLRVPPDSPAGALAEQVFRRHVALARRLDKALVVHCVRMHADCTRIVRAEGRGDTRGVVHAFAGSLEEARLWRRLGFVVGIGPILLRSARLATTLRALDVQGWVLETDAPHMDANGPRGTGTPDDLLVVADVVASLLGMTQAAVFEHNHANAAALLGRPL